VVVATTMSSISPASIPAASMAFSAACWARSLVSSPSAAIWRSRMPVRSTIHSLVVSICFSNSALVSTRAGRWLPVPMMRGIDSGHGIGRIGHASFSFFFGRSVMVGAHLLGDTPQQAAAHFLDRLEDGLFEGEYVGGAVALDDHAVESQQAGAVVPARVQLALEGAQHRQGDDSGKTGNEVFLEFTAQLVADQLGESLRSLQGDIADEAVAHHHIHGSLVDVVAFHIALEIETAGLAAIPRPASPHHCP
jgi:hypothetical protein